MTGDQGDKLPEDIIADVQDSYKSLGIPQAYGNHEKAARKSPWNLHRIRQLHSNQLNGQNVIQAINTYALPVIRYPAGTMTWSKKETETIHIKTRKFLSNIYLNKHSAIIH